MVAVAYCCAGLVAVAQVVEPQTVDLVVAGSSPVSHPSRNPAVGGLSLDYGRRVFMRLGGFSPSRCVASPGDGRTHRRFVSELSAAENQTETDRPSASSQPNLHTVSCADAGAKVVGCCAHGRACAPLIVSTARAALATAAMASIRIGPGANVDPAFGACAGTHPGAEAPPACVV